MSAYEYESGEEYVECAGEMIDGIWQGDGCADCREVEGDTIEADYEMGNISYATAMNRHLINDMT